MVENELIASTARSIKHAVVARGPFTTRQATRIRRRSLGVIKCVGGLLSLHSFSFPLIVPSLFHPSPSPSPPGKKTRNLPLHPATVEGGAVIFSFGLRDVLSGMPKEVTCLFLSFVVLGNAQCETQISSLGVGLVGMQICRMSQAKRSLF